MLLVVDSVTLADRECLARPSFALKIAVYAAHILFGFVILAAQFVAYIYDLHLKIRFYDIGIVVGCFIGTIGVCGVIMAICCVGVNNDRAFRFASSIVGAVLSIILLGWKKS